MQVLLSIDEDGDKLIITNDANLLSALQFMFLKYSKHGEPFRFIIHLPGQQPPTTIMTGNCQDEIQCGGCQVEYRLIRRVNGAVVIFIIQIYFLKY